MAPTGDVLFWTFLILGFLITLTAAQLLVSALLPRVVASARHTLGTCRVASPLGGGVVLLATIVVAGLGQLNAFTQVIWLLFLAVILTLTISGLAAFSRIVGERMPSAIDKTSPWRPTLRGAITCNLAFTTPVLGWFAFGLTALAAAGAGTRVAVLMDFAVVRPMRHLIRGAVGLLRRSPEQEIPVAPPLPVVEDEMEPAL